MVLMVLLVVLVGCGNGKFIEIVGKDSFVSKNDLKKLVEFLNVLYDFICEFY